MDVFPQRPRTVWARNKMPKRRTDIAACRLFFRLLLSDIQAERGGGIHDLFDLGLVERPDAQKAVACYSLRGRSRQRSWSAHDCASGIIDPDRIKCEGSGIGDMYEIAGASPRMLTSLN
jgi:hypothetical protein